jgi:hypothetical protein
VILKDKRLTRDQRKLAFSLIANFSTRVPGLAGVLFFLPRLKNHIGLQSFATVMAAIALGGIATFVMGGIGYVSRRLVGDAFSRGDMQGEADAGRGIFDVAVAAALLCSVGIVSYGFLRGSSGIFYAGALASALAVLVQQQDAVRAAYNEHYVTAIIQVTLQTLTYAVVLIFLPPSAYSALLGVAVITAPMILSSALSLSDLLIRRRYLLRGRPNLRARIAREGLIIGFGEGLLMASLGLVILYLDFIGASAASAWYATTLRLFTVVLVPVVLVLTPLSSYIRLIWNDCTASRQQTIIFATLLISIIYSIFVGVAMIVLSRLYVGGAMHMAEPGSRLQTLTIFAMFTAVVVFKSYASVAFVVLDSRKISLSAVVGTLISIGAAAASVPWLTPIGAVSLFSATLTLAIVVITIADALRFRNTAAAAKGRTLNCSTNHVAGEVRDYPLDKARDVA